MSTEVMFVAIAGMGTFLLMIHIIGKAETDKARVNAAGSEDTEGMKRLLADNTAEISRLRARFDSSLGSSSAPPLDSADAPPALDECLSPAPPSASTSALAPPPSAAPPLP
jgi:hypothetical protein